MTATADTKVIGYFAFASPTGVVCDGDACIIAGSDVDLRGYMAKLGYAGAGTLTLKKTRFGEIMRGIRLGAPYAFDEISYNRFYPLARSEGLDLGPEDFSAAGPGTGLHFVRVQLRTRA